jgi:hypothetical protein
MLIKKYALLVAFMMGAFGVTPLLAKKGRMVARNKVKPKQGSAKYKLSILRMLPPEPWASNRKGSRSRRYINATGFNDMPSTWLPLVNL